MKRLFVLFVSMACASSSFAYYGDYSYSSPKLEMPGWLVFMSIVMIVWGILEIVLFFKVWGMTDNVKAMKKAHFNEMEFESKAEIVRFLRENLVLGNMENVKKILLKNFIDNLKRSYAKLPVGGYEKDENGVSQYVSYKEKNLKVSIRPYIESLQKQYDKIGEQMPVYIQRMETFGDYYKLFMIEDLEVKTEKQTDKKED